MPRRRSPRRSGDDGDRDRRDIARRDVEPRDIVPRDVDPQDVEPRDIQRRDIDPRDIRPRNYSEGIDEYYGEAAEDRREEREDTRDARRSFYREEAEDRRLNRQIRADTYQEFQREELLDQREDRREEREISDRVRLERGSRFGGVFATEEDRAFKQIQDRRAREEKREKYRELIQQCEDRQREYHQTEDWLHAIKRSDFSQEVIAEVRTQVRELQRESLAHAVQTRLLNEQVNWNEEERRVIGDLGRVSELEERIYGDVLRACDDKDPNKLDYALDNVRACDANVRELLRRIPDLAAEQQREVEYSGQFGYVIQGVGRTFRRFWLVAILVGFVAGCGIGFATDGFVGALTTSLFLPFLALPALALIGAVIGYLEWKSTRQIDHFG